MTTATDLRRLAHSKAFQKAASELLVATARARATREKVDAYVRPIFDSMKFPVAAEFAETPGQLVENPRDLYLCEEGQALDAFDRACYEAHRSHGYAVAKVGDNPALIAEHDQLKAEWHLLELAGPALGFDGKSINGHMEERKAMLKLLLELFVKAAGEKIAA